jgi:hypothetical protein
MNINLNPKTKFFAILILAAVVVVAAILIYRSYYNKNTGQPISSNIKPLSVNEWPALLPRDAFLEPDAKILEFYTQTIADKEEIVLKYVTKKDLSENFILYKKYFDTNRWTIQNLVDEETRKVLSAERGQRQLSVNINKDATAGQNIVIISAIPKAPPPALAAKIEEKNLSSRALISFPEISGKTNISGSQLPVSFQGFIKENGIIDAQVQKLNFADKRTGFLITGTIPNISMMDAEARFMGFSQKIGWQFKKSSRAEQSAFAEYEGNGYEMRISYKLAQNNGANAIEVSLQAIKKQ